jgi:predicted Zn finger-like uncharacterized protein
MYTQCPECGEAFRVTAEVLKQAAGRVRCGGCGNAFNALEHLSEQAPKPRPRKTDPNRSAALRETVDRLVGPEDVRIEDTGVEWRVLDTDEAETPEAPPPARDDGDEVPDLIADTGMLRFLPADGGEEDAVDELLEASPTPVDEELTASPGTVDAAEVFEEMRFDDNTPLPEDFDADRETPPPPEPPVVSAPQAPERDDPQVDLAFGEPDEWQDLLGEVGDARPEPGVEASAEADETAEARELSDETSADDLVVLEDAAAGEPEDELPDMDTQFAMQAEAMGIDLSGTHAAIDEKLTDAIGADVDKSETSIDEDLIAAAFETEAAERADQVPEDVPTPEADADDGGLTLADEEAEISRAAGYEIPEMSEEEKTINLLIDQDLLSIAVEDEDGFASTIVQKQPDRKVEAELEELKAVPDEGNPLVETIIMEGDDFRNAPNEDVAAEGERPPEFGFAARARDTMRSVMANDRHGAAAPRRGGMITGVVVLTLLLLAQIAHQSRDAFATVPAFNRAVGPVYRMLGKPLTPAWDIKGWRFEKTRGSENDEEDRLTIYTRIGNKSDKALPYPLLHVSLTDRFEEIIGSRVLEPGEYLAADADPRKPVAAGNTFDAVVTIDTPAPEATGFKLNVCYRLASGLLRCAIEDFK